jgi:transposase
MLPILSTSHTNPVELFDPSSERLQEIIAEQCEEGGHADFLNITGLKSNPAITEQKYTIKVRAEQVKISTYPPNCTCEIKEVKAHTSFDMKGVLDLPHAHKIVVVDIERRRWMCKTCKKTVTQSLDILAEGHYRLTRRLVEYCEVQALLGTELSLSEETGIELRGDRY